MSIQEHLNKIRNAVYGHEVRESIAKGIETAYDDASEKDNANMEVKIARGTHPNLRSRLEEVDNKQQQTTAQLQQTATKKIGDGVLAGMGDLNQEVKTAMTGGSVAVVGEGAVATGNLANDLKKLVAVKTFQTKAGIHLQSPTSPGRTRFNNEPSELSGYLKELKLHSQNGGNLIVKIFSENSDGTFNVENSFTVTITSGQVTISSGVHFPKDVFVDNGWFVGFYDNDVGVHYYLNTTIINRTFVGEAKGGNVQFDSSQTLTLSFGYVVEQSLESLPTLQKQVFDLSKSKTEETETSQAHEMNLPSRIYGLVGQELNIYFENIMSDRDSEFEFYVTSAVGKQYEKRFTVIPAQAGSFPITIKAIKDGVTATKNATIIVSATSAGSTYNPNVLMVGDSTTDNDYLVSKLQENLSSDVMNVNTIGTRGIAPNKHEAHSGWTVSHFMSAGSPFYINGKVDFSAYIANNSLPTPDIVTLNLGINDLFNYTDDSGAENAINAFIQNYKNLIANIKLQNTNVKIGVALPIPPNYSQDAFGMKYFTSQKRSRYKKNNFMLVKRLIAEYGNKESDNIYLIPIHTNLDTEHNFPTVKKPVNARNPKTVDFPADTHESTSQASAGVHPDISGYWQIADVFWYWLKYLAS